MSGSNSFNPAATTANAEAGEPVAMTVHSLPRPEAQGPADAHGGEAERRRTRVGRWKMLGVLAVCAAPVIASYTAYFVIRPEGRTNYSGLIAPARPAPVALPLATLDGRKVDVASLKGQWLLVTVGDAACDIGCEKRLYLQRQLREMTGRERERIDKLWLVTDDAPLRPELRAALAAAPATLVLRVPRDALAAWLEPAAGNSLEQHLYIVDPLGGWMMRTPSEPDPAKLKKDLERLLRASAGWDRAGR